MYIGLVLLLSIYGVDGVSVQKHAKQTKKKKKKDPRQFLGCGCGLTDNHQLRNDALSK